MKLTTNFLLQGRLIKYNYLNSCFYSRKRTGGRKPYAIYLDFGLEPAKKFHIYDYHEKQWAELIL